MLIQCPHCEKRYRVSDKALGKKVQCSNPDCQQYFKVSNKPMPTPRDEFLKATHSSWSSNEKSISVDKRTPIVVLTPPPLSHSKRVLPPVLPPPLPNESSGKVNSKNILKIFRNGLLKKRTVIIGSAVIGFVILCLLVLLIIMAAKGGNSFFSPYQVEYKFQEEYYYLKNHIGLEIKIKGPAAKLAIILIDPKGETKTEIIEEEEMVDNIETVSIRVSMNDYSSRTPEPGTYTLLVKTFNPEKVVFRENFKSTETRRAPSAVRETSPAPPAPPRAR